MRKGIVKIYHNNGSVSNIYNYNKNMLHGTDIYYDENGKIIACRTWKYDKIKGLYMDNRFSEKTAKNSLAFYF